MSENALAALAFRKLRNALGDDPRLFKSMFATLDVNKDGSLSKDEISGGLSRAVWFRQLGLTKKDALAMAKRADSNGADEITYSMFEDVLYKSTEGM